MPRPSRSAHLCTLGWHQGRPTLGWPSCAPQGGLRSCRQQAGLLGRPALPGTRSLGLLRRLRPLGLQTRIDPRPFRTALSPSRRRHSLVRPCRPGPAALPQAAERAGHAALRRRRAGRRAAPHAGQPGEPVHHCRGQHRATGLRCRQGPHLPVAAPFGSHASAARGRVRWAGPGGRRAANSLRWRAARGGASRPQAPALPPSAQPSGPALARRATPHARRPISRPSHPCRAGAPPARPAGGLPVRPPPARPLASAPQRHHGPHTGEHAPAPPPPAGHAHKRDECGAHTHTHKPPTHPASVLSPCVCSSECGAAGPGAR